MTKYEKKQFGQWKRGILERRDKALILRESIHEKYRLLNGDCSRLGEFVIFEIVNCEKVSMAERVSDLRKYLSCIQANAKFDSLLSILHICHS